MASPAKDSGIIWSDDFLIGIDELDYEHKCLIEEINLLHQALLKHIDKAKIKNTLSSILGRLQAHFALEERFMVSHEYPYYSQHKAEHEALLDNYAEHMMRFEREMNLREREEIEKILRHWIVEHILTSDKQMSLMVIGDKKDIT